MRASRVHLLITVVFAFVGSTLAGDGEPRNASTKVVVTGTKLSFDPRTCKEGEGGFPWALGSVHVKVLGHQDGECMFDFRHEVEGAGNYQVDRVRVPVDSGPVVIEASERRGEQEHDWSGVYTSFTVEQATLVRRMQFGWFQVPVGQDFVSYYRFRAGDKAPPVSRGDKMTLRFLIFLDDKFNTPTISSGWQAQWVQRVTTRVGEGGKWQWVQSVAEGMTPYEIRHVRLPADVAGPAQRWGPGFEDGATLYAEMQLIDVDRK